MLDDIRYCKDVFGLDVVGFCCNNGADCGEFRRLLDAEMSWLMIILCWAKQINHTVRDFLTLKIGFMECIPKALEVIEWFNGHNHALDLFQHEQRSVDTGKALALIMPVRARWTAHFCSVRRLRQVQDSMKACWNKHSQALIECGGPKAELIKDIAENPQFWTDTEQSVQTIPHI
jgi:hypothetical protein